MNNEVKSDLEFGAYIHSVDEVVWVEGSLTRMGAQVILAQRHPEQKEFSMRVRNSNTKKEI